MIIKGGAEFLQTTLVPVQGGNDYEIFSDERTIGHSVTTFHDTIKLLDQLFP